jgi:hypothetical protein
MTRRLRFAALAAVGALAFSACANNDAKESDVVNAMEDAGLDTEQAECVGQGIDEAFGDDQDLYNDVASAVDTDEFPEGTEDQINDILSQCIEGTGSTDSTDTTEADGTGETTETTAAGG